MGKPIGQMTTGELLTDLFFKGLWVQIVIDILTLFRSGIGGAHTREEPACPGFNGLGEWEDPTDPVWQSISLDKACGFTPEGGWDQYREKYEEKLKSVRVDEGMTLDTAEWPQWLRDQEGEWLFEQESRSHA